MPTALLDTNAVSDLMRDHPLVKARLAAHPDAIATSVVVVGEIRYGLNRMPIGKKRLDLEVRAQLIIAALQTETVTASIADVYGKVKAEMEAQGVMLGDNDLWIAATALALGALVVSRDSGFTNVPNLQSADWSA